MKHACRRASCRRAAVLDFQQTFVATLLTIQHLLLLDA
jgi:hypothetical protein